MPRMRLARWWDALRASFWFLPVLMLVGAAGLSAVTLAIDHELDRPLGGFWWVDTGSPEAARTLLLLVAGSMIGVAGVTFSITIVTLTLATSQFGNRLLRHFLRDRVYQAALGTFVATFLYCMLVLPAVDSGSSGAFVPQVSLATAELLAAVSTLVLVLFIHHVATSIRATNIVSAVARELDAAVARLYPPGPSLAAPHAPELPDAYDGESAAIVRSPASGYIQTIDVAAIVDAATASDSIVVLLHPAGQFLVPNMPIARVWPPDRCDPVLCEAVQAAVHLGSSRTILQDVEFAIDQIVEIAVRALSPGVSDPFTAIECVDRLGQAVGFVAERDLPPNAKQDEAQQLRFVGPGLTFGGVMDAAFNQIRQHARGNVAVLIRLLATYAVIGERCRTSEQVTAVRLHAVMTHRSTPAAELDPADAEDLDRRFRRTLRVLRAGHESSTPR